MVSYLTQNVNSLTGALLDLAGKPLVQEEKSLVPPTINLGLWESEGGVSAGRLAACKMA